jgi:hypothetical protein
MSGNTKVLPAPFRLPPVELAAAKLAPNASVTTVNAAARAVFLDTFSLLLLDDTHRIGASGMAVGRDVVSEW